MNMLKNSLCSFLLLATSLALAAPPAIVTKVVTGEAAIMGGNKAIARQEAKKNALREAVEQVSGINLTSESLTLNSQLVRDQIATRSEGYIKKYEVTSERVEGGVMKVTVKADVGAADINKDLQAIKGLIARLQRSKMILLLNEQAIDSKGVNTSSGTMAQALTEGFKEAGWTILDPNIATGGKLRVASGTALGVPEAKEIGEISKADYIVYGQVTFRYQSTEGMMMGGGKNWFPVTGEWDLTVFATDSGTQLTKLTGKFDSGPKGVGPKGSPLISYERTAHDISKFRGKEIMGEVRKAVTEHLRNAEINGNRVVVSVMGLGEYASVRNFQKVLGELSGMREVKSDTFKNNKALYNLTYVGSTDDLADTLGTKTFRGRKISVTGVTGNTLELVLAK